MATTARHSRTAYGEDQFGFFIDDTDDATNRAATRHPAVQMQIQSLAFQTDIGIRRLAGATVTDHDDHLVVKTPANPNYWWGNFILLSGPPAAGAAGDVGTMFSGAFPGAAHIALGVDGTAGETGDPATLAELGVDVETNHVLETAALREPDPPAGGPVLRRLSDHGDWAQAVDVRLEVYEEAENDAHRVFVERQFAESRQICERGDGGWFGAFADGRLVATLGLIRALPGTGRYQGVETLEPYRRRGLAARLLYEASRWGAGSLDMTRFVICADPEYHALRLYEALGFTVIERQVQLQRPPSDA
jgi:RimJ/RimL family protein N-acetyltransferase